MSSKCKHIAVVGAGFSGAVIAHRLASAGYRVSVIESRSHIGGNCYTERDKATGVLVHKYGPHIFHTDNHEVWSFVNSFTDFKPYTNRVKAVFNGQVYSLPVNLHTINQFFGETFSPSEAQSFIESQADKSIADPQSFEEQALKFVGRDLYQAFFYGYTRKQWGCEPTELPASILKRLPVRFNYNDNYFNHQYQGMPEEGYTPIFEKLLDHPNIKLQLDTRFERESVADFDHVFYTGPLDVFFGCEYGRLGYRTLDFVQEEWEGDYQGNAVINYSNIDVPYTRITEHKHFAPWEIHERTVIYKEYSRSAESDDIPYYPVRLLQDKELLAKYVEQAEQQQGVSFVGRLATYRYLDMDKCIEEAMYAAEQFLKQDASGNNIPAFYCSPL